MTNRNYLAGVKLTKNTEFGSTENQSFENELTTLIAPTKKIKKLKRASALEKISHNPLSKQKMGNEFSTSIVFVGQR